MRSPVLQLALVVLALAGVLYANAAANGFSHDDYPLIEQNPLLWDLGNVPRFFTLDYFEPHVRSGLYRPVVTTSYAVDRALFGTQVMGFHVVNILLHGMVSVLVLLLVWTLTRDRWIAGATALLFAAHAIHTEVVASLSMGRPDLLAALFGLLALQLHLLVPRVSRRRRRWLRTGSVACYGLGLFCKESAITILGLVILVDWVFPADGSRPSIAGLRRTLRTRFFSSYVPLLAVTVAFLGIRFAVLGSFGTSRAFLFVDNPLVEFGTLWRIINASWVLFRYLGLFLLPLHLSHDYSYDHIPMIRSLGDPTLVALAALSVVSLAVVAWSYRHHREMLFAAGFFLVSFSVGSNVLAPITTMMGERVLYLPSLGLCLALALALRGACGALPTSARARNAVFAALMGVVIALNGWRTVTRNPDWRDMHSIRLRDVALHPRNAKLQTNAGYYYRMLGDSEKAIQHFDAAIGIVGDPERWVEPFRGKVVALIDLGRLQEARVLYEEVRPYAANAEIEAVLRRAARSGERGGSRARGASSR